MADFAFGELLSPIDFEHLVRDLLSKDLSVELTAFAEGGDGGIDLRYSKTINSNEIVVQCKRQKSIGKQILEAERDKLKLLKLKKYYLASSSDFSVQKTNQILEIFSKWMPNDKHIYSKNKLNILLDKHKEIFRRHYKLWINSSELFNSYINKSLIERSKFLFNSIKVESKYYVRNEGYNEALDILQKYNFLIISGIPGIGKTTLARILLREYVEKEFEVIDMKKISEGEQFLEEDSNTKQVFYFDDFLGENFLKFDVLSGRSSDLLDFIKRISLSKNKKLILTTREYILNQAKERYEKMQDHDFELAKQILDLEKYTERDKAYILYNHLFYSGIGEEYILNIIENRNYEKIIYHRNYSPRIVERMTVQLKNIEPAKYSKEFLKHLDNPFIIWDRAFDNQISEGSQGLLYVLLSFDGKVVKQELKQAFKSFLSQNNALIKGEILHFDKYIKEIEDTFIISHACQDSKYLIFKFQNPSVKDFLINILKSNRDILLQLIDSIEYFNQLRYLINFADREFLNEAVFNHLSSKVFAENELKDDLYIFLDGSVFESRRTKVERIYICAELVKLVREPKLKSFLFNRILDIDIESISTNDISLYLEMIEEFKEEIKIQKESIIDRIFGIIRKAEDIFNFLKIFDIFPTEIRIFSNTNKSQLEHKFKEVIMESIEDAKRTYDVHQIQRCIQKIDSIKTHDEAYLIQNVGFYYESADEKLKQIQEKEDLKEKSDNVEKLDNLDEAAYEDFNLDQLFRIENFDH
jgi:DNA polymerase III delta prime subunit